VTPNGLGDLLIFGYWTAYDRDTLVAITNTFGGQSQRYVHVRIREGVNSNEVANFTICLSPGDVWTAAITSTGRNASTSSLLIGDPGTCDGSVTNAQGLTPPPAPGDPPLGLNADFGYIEAYTLECNSPVLAPGCPASPQAPFGNNNGGDDTIMGTATLVSATAGFSRAIMPHRWLVLTLSTKQRTCAVRMVLEQFVVSALGQMSPTPSPTKAE
jgi:hypothetical protein